LEGTRRPQGDFPPPAPFCWGIDRHIRTMDVCILSQAGETGHRNLTAPPDAREAMAPSRADRPGRPRVCPGTARRRCAAHGLRASWDRALSPQARHGGTATHSQSPPLTLPSCGAAYAPQPSLPAARRHPRSPPPTEASGTHPRRTPRPRAHSQPPVSPARHGHTDRLQSPP
jgi:hypothetical protein